MRGGERGDSVGDPPRDAPVGSAESGDGGDLFSPKRGRFWALTSDISDEEDEDESSAVSDRSLSYWCATPESDAYRSLCAKKRSKREAKIKP